MSSRIAGFPSRLGFGAQLRDGLGVVAAAARAPRASRRVAASAVARRDQRRARGRGSPHLSRSAIDSSASGASPSAPAVRGGISDAPVSALAIATRGSSAIPMTSPVDCMNGPTDGSTPLSLAVENAGALTATNGGVGRRPAAQPSSASVAPSEIRTASSTIGTPVTLDRNGTVRDARGLTSIR